MKTSQTRSVLLSAVLALATIGTANAAGCLKGAVGGCLVGRHLAKQHAQQEAAQRQAAMHASVQPH